MMTMKHVAPMALMLLSLTGCATASNSQVHANDIQAKIIGNTVVGVDEGKPYQEYYNPNGSISGKDTDNYTGSWRIDGNKLCTGYESNDETKTDLDWTCSGVAVDGDTVIWEDTEGEKSDAKLLPGNQVH
jgi:hypothetical protein